MPEDTKLPAPDLQSFVAELEQRGWLKRIAAEVDPILEITEITDRVTKAGGPALLFEHVKGSRWPLLINSYGTRERMCLALGVQDFTEVAERVRALVKPEMPTTLMDKLRKLPELVQLGSLPPKIVRRGLCQEVVHTDDADLTKLPALKCWPQDGDLTRMVSEGPAQRAWFHIRVRQPEPGRVWPLRRPTDSAGQTPRPEEVWNRLLSGGPVVGRRQAVAAAAAEAGPHVPTEGTAPGRYLTLTNVFTRDPETGARNIGMYRVQVFGPKLAAMHWHLHHDGARHFRMYERLGRRMPLAVSFGGPAILPYAATCPLPPGIDETLFAGFLQGRAIELAPCVTQPEIEVPATAEIVVEGYIDPGEELILEGPFGDHTGFYSLADLYPRFRVTAVTHRKTPIFPATIVGKPPQEDFWFGKATERIFLPLVQMLIPDIIDYNLPMFGCFHNCVFVRIKKEYPYQARRVMAAIWGAGQMAFTKIIVVVDEHVDVHDEQQVLFHLCANVDPKRDIMFVEGPLDILDHAAPACGAGSKMGIDATRKIPGEGQVREWPEEIEMSAEVKDLVTRRWSELGL